MTQISAGTHGRSPAPARTAPRLPGIRVMAHPRRRDQAEALRDRKSVV